MRTPAPRLRMLTLPVAIVAALALLLQVALPPGAFSAPPGLGSICHAAQHDGGTAPPQLPNHNHEHCLLCQVGTVAFLLPAPAPPPPIPIAAASPAPSLPADGPRAAPRLAYASRAPPTIG